MPAGLLGHALIRTYESRLSIPVCCRPFLFVSEASVKATLVVATEVRHLFGMPTFAKATVGDRSTDSKQTLNGLFYVNSQSSFFLQEAD
jgi:hypothetical protein